MPKLFRTIRHLLNRRQAERDLAEELSAHREMLGEDRQRIFGSPLRLREESRDAWGLTWLDQLWQDLAYGARSLRRSPGFTLTAILVLSLGVGLNLSVFHLFKSIFYGRIAVADSAFLQRVVRQSPAREMYSFPSALAEFLRENATQFSYLVTERFDSVPLRFENDPQNVRAQFVSGNYFTALRVAPLEGRLLSASDDVAAPAVVLSYGFWQRRYGADPSVISRIVLVNAKPVQIVGVTPAEFDGLSNGGDLWLPASQRNYLVGQTQPLEAFLRSDTALFGVLKPEGTPVAAAAQLHALTTQWRGQQASAIEKDEVIRARPLGDDERNFGTFLTLIPMVLLVLLASCANLGNMLLARGLARAREIETRIAVGAGSWRMVRQLMTENLLLATLGAIGGLLVARIGTFFYVTIFRAVRGESYIVIETDWFIVLVAVGFALLTAVLFGLAPALSAVRGAHRNSRTRRVLLGVQVAASCVLVVSSTLIARGAERLTASGSRLKFEQIVTVDPSLRNSNLAPAAARKALDSVGQQIAQLPGVRGVTYASGVPVFGVRIENIPGLPTTFWQAVAPSYFALMGVPITRGRNFESNEPENNVIISESAARYRWPDENPIGKVWELEGAGRTVIGVAADTDATAFRNPSAIEAYGPLSESLAARTLVIVRTSGDPLPQIQNIRTAATLPGLTPTVRLLQDQVDMWVDHAGGATELVGGLGAVTSFLAAIGIFGLIAFAVTERTREIGVRIALGARSRNILGTLFAHYTQPLVLGAVVGIALAAWGAQTMQSMIILGLVEFDLLGYVLGLAALALIVLAAVIIPVRRALRIDPASALRWE